MSSESPASELYSSTGVELSVLNNTALPTTPYGLISVGSDGTNSRFIKVDTSGNTIIVGLGTAGTPSGGVVSVQGVSGGTAIPVSGTVAVTQSTSPWINNITQFGGTNISTGTGASGTGIPRVTVSNDSNVLATQSGTWTVQPGNTANTTPWLTTINQGGNSAAVKAASTAAVATDPALVVAISPNNSIGLTTNDITATGSLGALNAAVQLAVAGTRNAGMQLVAGTLVGTIVPEISMDGGTTWVGSFFDDPTTSNITSSITFGSSNTATTRTIVGSGGSSHVRIRVSAFTSGTATCNLRASTLLDPTTLYGGASGSGLPPVVIQDGGSVTTSAPTYTTATINALSLNTTGDLRVTGKVTDGTNTAAVKAASTAPLATDPALVVTLSPNSVAQANATGSGTVNALNGNVVATAAGYGSIIFNITGTWVATFTTQATNGDGTWINVASLSNQSGLITGTTNINGSLEMNAAGWTQARLIATAYTSGTATITWSAGQYNHVIIPYSANGINFQTNTALVDSSQNFLGTTAASTSATASQEALVIQQSPIMPKATTATLTSVNSSTSSVSLLASNANRTGVIIVNDSTATLFVAFASTASTTAYTFRLTSDAVLELPNLPIYTGAISGISSSTNGAIRITELSP